VRRFDLRSLRFGDESETWRRVPVEVAPFVFGGLEYTVPEGVVELELRAARVGEHLTLTASLESEVDGPCQRCLEPAHVKVTASGLDVVRHGESEVEDEGERYTNAFSVDVVRWVRDLIADALPVQLLCREDCAGLCPVCGANLNDDPGHTHEADGGAGAT
jgi:DUF177 domain-containing protein